MRQIPFGSSDLMVPTIALGCMRMAGLNPADAEKVVATCLDQGMNFFDHADIYGGGKSEEVFAAAVKALGVSRDKLIVQSKFGIRKGMYDFSKEHLTSAVEGILKRLNTDYLDALLLHRPDALCEPDEVAEVFNKLYIQGKVKFFGVSNHNSMQIELLKKSVRQPIIANQLQFSITNATMVSSGINVNTLGPLAVMRDGSILDYCRLHDITIQPWSPFQYGFFEGVFLGNDKFPELNQKIDEIAARHAVTNTTIAIAWILRHPAHMQPIVGTMNPTRILDVAKAADVTLSREEWYDIYRAAGNLLP